MKIRNQLYKAIGQDRQAWRAQCEKVSILINARKKQIWADKIEECKSDPSTKKLWEISKQLKGQTGKMGIAALFMEE